MRLGDLWRGELSIRELSVYLAYLPVGSAVWAIQTGLPYGWTLTDLLLTDLFHALTGEPHPSRPNPQAAHEREARAAMFARLKEQRERLSKPQPD